MAPSSRIRRDRVKLHDRDGELNRNCLPILGGLDGAGEPKFGDLADEAICWILG